MLGQQQSAVRMNQQFSEKKHSVSSLLLSAKNVNIRNSNLPPETSRIEAQKPLATEGSLQGRPIASAINGGDGRTSILPSISGHRGKLQSGASTDVMEQKRRRYG